MTIAELVAWQRRNGLRTDVEAALVLGMSPHTYWRKRHGLTKITRQNEMLCEYYEVLQKNIINVAALGEVANKLVRLAMLGPHSGRDGVA